MDFTLSDEEALLRDTARALMARECPPSLVRAHITDRAAATPLWARLAEWTGLADGPLVDQCLFAEELGAVLAPGPFLATTALFAPLARMTGAPGGAAWGTVMLADDPRLPFVLDADVVDTAAVVVPGVAPSVAFVPAEDLDLRPVPVLDTTRRCYEPVRMPGLAAAPLDPDGLDDVLARAAVVLAAELSGTTRWMVAATVQYAKDRVQFDRPIGSFQAIKHKLADMALARERAAAAVYAAAMAHDAADPSRHEATHVAKAAAGEAATLVAKEAVQIHGGIGFTWEHDLHLYVRRAYTSEALLGTTAWHHDRLAELLLA